MKGTTCRTAKHIVFMASLLPLLLGGCMQDATLAPSESPVAAAVAKELGGNRFMKVHSERNAQGYTIESGNLTDRLKGTAVGALVVVTDKGGAITAFIDRDGQHGILQVDAAGKRTFSPDADLVYPEGDAVVLPELGQASKANAAPGAITYVDALVGFTTKALAARAVDPVAFALGQMEWVNLSLRNSKVQNIELRLAGVRVTEEDIPVTTSGLSTWQSRLNAQRADYLHDINVGFSVGGNAAGWASRPGYSSINSIHGTSPFKHEMGHNVGGLHCYPSAGDNYKHGYNAGGGFTTNLCGNGRPYYSTPDVTVDGKVIGDAKTADMARLWREQAARLSGYSPAFEGARLVMVSPHHNIIGYRAAEQRSTSAFVALATDVGPVKLEPLGYEGMTILTVKLSGANGSLRPVNLRAYRLLPCGFSTAMNSTYSCSSEADGPILALIYEPIDNPELPPGWYNGVLRLKALDQSDAAWEHPILISLALHK